MEKGSDSAGHKRTLASSAQPPCCVRRLQNRQAPNTRLRRVTGRWLSTHANGCVCQQGQLCCLRPLRNTHWCAASGWSMPLHCAIFRRGCQNKIRWIEGQARVWHEVRHRNLEAQPVHGAEQCGAASEALCTITAGHAWGGNTCAAAARAGCMRQRWQV